MPNNSNAPSWSGKKNASNAAATTPPAECAEPVVGGGEEELARSDLRSDWHPTRRQSWPGPLITGMTPIVQLHYFHLRPSCSGWRSDWKIVQASSRGGSRQRCPSYWNHLWWTPVFLTVRSLEARLALSVLRTLACVLRPRRRPRLARRLASPRKGNMGLLLGLSWATPSLNMAGLGWSDGTLGCNRSFSGR